MEITQDVSRAKAPRESSGTRCDGGGCHNGVCTTAKGGYEKCLAPCYYPLPKTGTSHILPLAVMPRDPIFILFHPRRQAGSFPSSQVRACLPAGVQRSARDGIYFILISHAKIVACGCFCFFALRGYGGIPRNGLQLLCYSCNSGLIKGVYWGYFECVVFKFCLYCYRIVINI